METPEPPRTGALERPWAAVMTLTWWLAVLAIAAATLASRSVGKPAWWTGTSSDPAFFALWALPFVAPVVAMVSIRRWPRRSPWIGVACSLVTGGCATGDVVNSPGTAVVLAAVAAATLLASVASFAGRTRVPPAG